MRADRAAFGAAVVAIALGASFLTVTSVTAGQLAAKCFGKKATIHAKPGATTKGTKGKDVIVGTSGSDLIKAKGGGDRVCGGGGTDLIVGGSGVDLLDGGSGDDSLKGGKGEEDVLLGGAGNDALNGGPGLFSGIASYADSPNGVVVDLGQGVATGRGTDTLTKISGVGDTPFDDQLTGSDLREEGDGFFLSSGNDTIDGGGGEFDTILYLDASVPVTIDIDNGTATGDGIDTTMTGMQDVIGSPFDDTLIGNDLDNFMWGLDGDDMIFGGDGDDFVEVPLGNDEVDGQLGDDTAAFGFAGGPVDVNLSAGTATIDSTPQETPTLIDMESLFGSFDFDDLLIGDDGPNTIVGLGGGDEIRGLGGDDFLDGDFFEEGLTFPGTDVVDGGDGADTCVNAEDETNCEAAPEEKSIARRYLRWLD